MKTTNTQPTVATATSAPGAPAAAERVLKALAKLVGGRKIYADNNPRLAQFRDELATSLREFFAIEDELVLTFEQFSIHWNEHVVYENLKRDESLAFIFFKDGIGEVTLTPPAIGNETDVLVQMIADDLYLVNADEDMVTRFWNADFQHITHRVLDDYLAGENPLDPGQSGGVVGIEETADHDELLPSLTDKGRVIVHRSDSLKSIDVLLRDVSRRHHPNANEEEAELEYQRMLRSMFSIPVDELEIYRAELEREHASDSIADFFESFYVFELMTDNPTGVRDVSVVLDRLMDFAIGERNAATLERMIRVVQEFQARPNLPFGVKQFGEKMLARAGNGDLVASLLEGVTEINPQSDAAISCAVAIGPAATDALVRVLHRTGVPALHRRICDALIAISPEAAAAVIDRLDVDKAEIAVDAVYLAKTLQLDALSPRLRELVFYPDPRVKLEILGWIASRNDADTTNLLLTSLGDLDRRVRVRVLEALCERRDARVRERITEMAFAKDLGERPGDEQEAIFRTLGAVGDAQTVVQLRALVDKRRLIPIGKGTPDIKLLAIRALERMREPAAAEILERLCGDPNETVRQRAQRARDVQAATTAGATPAGTTRTQRS